MSEDLAEMGERVFPSLGLFLLFPLFPSLHSLSLVYSPL